MTPQERDLILGVAQRLRNAQLKQIDRDAEQLILAEIGSQKDALYQLTQAVIVQEHGLRLAQERIQQLEAACSPQGHGGFLSSLFGGGSVPPAPQPPPAGALQAPGGSGMGTFLGTAAAAAAGSVGGQLIYDGMRHYFGAHSPPASPEGGFLGGISQTALPPDGRHGANSRSEREDSDYSGTGGDFGSATDANESGGDFSPAEDATDATPEGADSDDADSADNPQGGGGF